MNKVVKSKVLRLKLSNKFEAVCSINFFCNSILKSKLVPLWSISQTGSFFANFMLPKKIRTLAANIRKLLVKCRWNCHLGPILQNLHYFFCYFTINSLCICKTFSYHLTVRDRVKYDKTDKFPKQFSGNTRIHLWFKQKKLVIFEKYLKDDLLSKTRIC